MLAPFADYSLLVALCFLCLALTRIAGKFSSGLLVMAVMLITLAFGVLIYAHVVSDFSFENVFRHSHTLKPLIYKWSGAWANHEGSLLLWIWYLALASLFLLEAVRRGWVPEVALRVHVWMLAGFLAFLWFTSSPFILMQPVPVEGMGLNPLLQDIGLALHPPMLYLGYLGFSIPFSIAWSALWAGRVEERSLSVMAPVVMLSWLCLSVGIALGGWWAYRELGWGGFWFWDPVENVSLMPWLSATVLVHCLLMRKRFPALVPSALFFALLTFVLCVMGTFLVRSGMLTSVHSFAQDASRGLFVLFILAGMGFSSFALFAWRMPRIVENIQAAPTPFLLLLLKAQTLLFVALLSVMILGTLYPLLAQLCCQIEVSVGAPYFNQMMGVLMMPLLALMALLMAVSWKDGALRSARIWGVLLVSFMVSGIAWWLLPLPELWQIVLLFVAIWVMVAVKYAIWKRIGFPYSFSPRAWCVAYVRLPLSFHAMCFAHMGAAIFVLGCVWHNATMREVEMVMKPGQELSLASYQVTLLGVEGSVGKNFILQRAALELRVGEALRVQLFPEYRFYPVEQSFTSESSIGFDRFRVLYAAMGQGDAETGYTMRFYYQPMILVVLLGCVVMVVGGMCGVWSVVRDTRRVACGKGDEGRNADEMNS